MKKRPENKQTVSKGRGAQSLPQPRYNEHQHDHFDDGWEDVFPVASSKTQISIEHPKSVISRNQSPDLPFDQSLNPFRGCEHGCIYCFARPTHAYLGLSPGLDFESKITVKPNAHEVLRKQLCSSSYQCKPIVLGANTDPYQTIERSHQVTRRILETLAELKHPCSITTKSSLVERDIDILQDMAGEGLVHVNISLTTFDPELARKLEPRASTPKRRLQTIATLSREQIPVNIFLAPVIPVLTDAEMEAILSAARQAGVKWAEYILLRLPLEVAPLFEEWLTLHVPDMANHVLNQIRDSRGGRNNDPRFGHRLKGEGVYANMIAQRFRLAVKKLALDKPPAPLNCDLFQQSPVQMDLFNLEKTGDQTY